MNAPPGVQIDHRDGNGLNCSRDNLRLCTNQNNRRNSRKGNRNTSGFKGVSFFKRDQNWRAYIMLDARQIHLGYFKTSEEAARAYDNAAKELFGEFASPNFNS